MAKEDWLQHQIKDWYDVKQYLNQPTNQPNTNIVWTQSDRILDEKIFWIINHRN